MDIDETIPTIQRDLAEIAAQLDIAKRFAREEGAKKTWYHLDLIEGRLQGLFLFIGLSHPWDDSVVEKGQKRAAESVLP